MAGQSTAPADFIIDRFSEGTVGGSVPRPTRCGYPPSKRPGASAASISTASGEGCWLGGPIVVRGVLILTFQRSLD
jgi:hypothetical protein